MKTRQCKPGGCTEAATWSAKESAKTMVPISAMNGEGSRPRRPTTMITSRNLSTPYSMEEPNAAWPREGRDRQQCNAGTEENDRERTEGDRPTRNAPTYPRAPGQAFRLEPALSPRACTTSLSPSCRPGVQHTWQLFACKVRLSLRCLHSSRTAQHVLVHKHAQYLPNDDSDQNVEQK